MPVAGADLDATDVEFGRNPDGGGVALGVEQVDAGIGDRAADGNPAIGGILAVEPGHVDGAFGGAVEVVQLHVG